MLTTRRSMTNERGATMVAMGLAMVAFLALAIVGVDLGRLAWVANEVQIVADVAATAGARALFNKESVVDQAQGVVVGNRVNGAVAQIAPPGEIQIGNYNFDTGIFAQGAEPNNAVKAIAQAEVSNFLAGMTINGLFGQPTTLVTKTAIAAFAPPLSGRPTLPIAFDKCKFPDPDCQAQSCLPQLQTVPSTTDNSGWTGFLGGSGQTDILNYFPSACRGDGQTAPDLYVGNYISINNGEITPLFNAVHCMVCDLGINEFLIPIVEDATPQTCDDNTQFNQTLRVTGFATITINQFHYSNGDVRAPCAPGGGAIDGIILSAMLADDGGSGPPGDTDSTGTFVVRMVSDCSGGGAC